EIDTHEGGLVAPHRALQERRATIALDRERCRREAVFRTVREEALPLLAGAAAEQLTAAARQRLQRDARHELEVRHVAGELLRILFDQLALAAAHVDLVEIVPLGFAVVEADKHD